MVMPCFYLDEGRSNEICHYFFTPNIDYRDFKQIIADLYQSFYDFESDGYQVLFMGSSMGGFTSEYMALKTNAKVIMINPSTSPITLLPQFIGTNENELRGNKNKTIDRTILLDMADELLDSQLTLNQFKCIAKIFTYSGGSYSFEHIEQALPKIKKVIYTLHGVYN
jgi:predicted esterase YcpF (UPF0227 family)